jgi:hypothetical protein
MRSGREHIRETKRSKLGLGRWGDVLPNAQRTIVRPLDDNDSKALASKRNGGCKAGGSAADHGDIELAGTRRQLGQCTVPNPITTPVGWASCSLSEASNLSGLTRPAGTFGSGQPASSHACKVSRAVRPSLPGTALSNA